VAGSAGFSSFRSQDDTELPLGVVNGGHVERVDIIYRYNPRETAIRPLPTDSNAALLRLDEGNKTFAALVDHVRNETGIQQIIPVDPQDLESNRSTSLRQSVKELATGEFNRVFPPAEGYGC
jgi:hypothetical protein